MLELKRSVTKELNNVNVSTNMFVPLVKAQVAKAKIDYFLFALKFKSFIFALI
jgi:hypothetical protein